MFNPPEKQTRAVLAAKLPKVQQLIFEPEKYNKLFESAEDLHRKYEEENGQPIVPENYPKTTQLIKFDTPSGAKVFLVSEVHNERQSPKKLREALKEIANTPREQILFISEGLEDASNRPEMFTSSDIIRAIAKSEKISLDGGIANRSTLKTVQNAIKTLGGTESARTEILSYLTLAYLQTTQFKAQSDVPFSIRDLKKTWGNKYSLDEMYSFADSALNLSPRKTRTLLSLTEQSKKALKVNELDFRKISHLETFMEQAEKSKEGFSKEELIGAAILLNGRVPQDSKSFDYNKALERFKKDYRDAFSAEDYHRAFCLLGDKLESKDRNFIKRMREIDSLIDKSQDQLTIEGLRERVAKYPKARVIVIISGFNHEKSIREALANDTPSR